jgi:hypothetical protein
VFLLAGHETTSTALSFALHLLGRHPEVQQRVREEVAGVVGDRMPTAEDARFLTYTTMVLKEAMRLFPSAPVVGPDVLDPERFTPDREKARHRYAGSTLGWDSDTHPVSIHFPADSVVTVGQRCPVPVHQSLCTSFTFERGGTRHWTAFAEWRSDT